MKTVKNHKSISTPASPLTRVWISPGAREALARLRETTVSKRK